MSHLCRCATRALLLSGMLFSAVAPAQTLLLSGPDGKVQVEKQALGQYGPTTRNDTLWRIATKVRPDTQVTVYQVMQALFDANTHAFTSENFNSLERNHVLTIPTRDVMMGYPASEAKQQAKNHDSNWVPTDEVKPAKPVALPVKQIEAAAEPAGNTEQQLAQLQQENKRLANDLDSQKDTVLQLQNLRAELDANAAQMALMVEQNAILQRQLQQLSQELSVLQIALDDQQSVNRMLEEELDAQRFEPLPKAVTNSPVVNEPEQEPVPSFWQSLGENTLALVTIGPLSILLIIGLLWFVMRRRHRPISPNPIQDGEMIKPISTPLDPLTEMVPEPVSPVVQTQAVAESTPAPVMPTATSLAESEQSVDEDNDVMSLDDLLKDEELNAANAESEAIYGDNSDFEQALAESTAEISAASEPPKADNNSAFGDDEFIDIDKLLAESENSPGMSMSDTEADTIAPASDPLSDDGGYSAKLDLARAYIEIEDVDSAKALLKEVKTEGNEAQRNEADSLLKQL
ncbi:FimV/HubP family polar landmark protein [Ferrimonas lipolytica]|uniref:Pilus assembly protein FimV n=1 Tax=Ferrimonas lipolytica TaxID=2724191 RepID=A0A6H1UF09_9GAMM|nr:FimV/HubP family polar landmark protein [Ferrimonas lipolytica]QIZ77180.1 hypothetical protein HER31_10010 [Ferrimonas lipolytica]